MRTFESELIQNDFELIPIKYIPNRKLGDTYIYTSEYDIRISTDLLNWYSVSPNDYIKSFINDSNNKLCRDIYYSGEICDELESEILHKLYKINHIDQVNSYLELSRFYENNHDLIIIEFFKLDYYIRRVSYRSSYKISKLV